jgi:DNA-binding transcriptional LysR family regulator
MMMADGISGWRRATAPGAGIATGSPAASLLARDVDIALRVGRLPTSGLVPEAVFHSVRTLRVAAYIRRFGSPATIDDLSGHRLIDFDIRCAYRAKPWLRAGGTATVTFAATARTRG